MLARIELYEIREEGSRDGGVVRREDRGRILKKKTAKGKRDKEKGKFRDADSKEHREGK